MTTKLALSLLGTVAITLNEEQINRQVLAKSQAVLAEKPHPSTEPLVRTE